jgi:hypothetical protein
LLRGRIALGAGAGLVFACLLTVCEVIGPAHAAPLESILRFLGGPAAFLAWHSGRLEWLAWVFFFGYWALIGAGFGLLSQSSSSKRTAFMILLVFLLLTIQLSAPLRFTWIRKSNWLLWD